MQLKTLVLVLALCLPCALVYAQGPGFEDDTEDTVPLDGGLSILAAAGIGYGIKKLKDAKKSKNMEL